GFVQHDAFAAVRAGTVQEPGDLRGIGQEPIDLGVRGGTKITDHPGQKPQSLRSDLSNYWAFVIGLLVVGRPPCTLSSRVGPARIGADRSGSGRARVADPRGADDR